MQKTINSLAVVDASAFSGQGDICGTINYILTSPNEFKCGGNNPKGVVVDARGIKPAPGGVLQCSSNPFDGTNNSNPCSGGFLNGEMLTSIVLLPAATIQAQKTWILPSNARVIGEGRNLTTIQAVANFVGDVIQMGSTTICPGNDCQGDGIENLTVDTQNIGGVNGIHNSYSQELSYVRNVRLTNNAGIGLLVDNLAGDSGPYTNIDFSGNGTCAQLLISTRGIHGLSCTAGAVPPPAAVLLDGPNSSIEDVYINGAYVSGILVGSNAPASGNVLFNVNGSSVGNVVAISSATSGNPPAPNVSDLSIFGVSGGHGGFSNTIADSLTNTLLSDNYVGMYVLGEPVTAGSTVVGYSRFSTSPNQPSITWLVGSGAPAGSCSTGSLYSNTAGPQGLTLWTCVSSIWKSVQ